MLVAATRLAAAASVFAGAALSPAPGQAFPTQQVRIVTSGPAGSSPDLVVRTLAEAMAPLLGQPVLVENRPGAGGTLATSAVAAAPADGHMLNVSGCSGDSITFAFTSQGRPPLALFRDLTPVGRLMRDHWLVLVPSTTQATTLEAFGRAAKAAADPAAYPSPGPGSTPHLQAERLARTMGFRALHVPYKDGSTADLVGGRLGYAVLPSAATIPLVAAGRLRALAVLSAERLDALPDVPTAEQAGLPDYAFNGGLCLWAPGGTPAAAQERLNRALVEAARQPTVRAKLLTYGVDPTPASLDETVRYVRSFAAESDRLRSEVFGNDR